MSLTSNLSQRCGREASSGKGAGLSPWPVRVAAWVVLGLLALAAIWVIDRHAMALSEKASEVGETTGS